MGFWNLAAVTGLGGERQSSRKHVGPTEGLGKSINQNCSLKILSEITPVLR